MLVSESVCHMPRAAQSDHAKCWPNAVLVVLEVNTGAVLKKVQKERGEKEREREKGMPKASGTPTSTERLKMSVKKSVLM